MTRSQRRSEIFGIAFALANLFLILSVVIFSVYLVAPFFGGTLSVNALAGYGSWIGLALGMRLIAQRQRQGLPARMGDYLIACLFAIANFALWFSYPANIVLSVLCIIGMIFSYRSRRRED